MKQGRRQSFKIPPLNMDLFKQIDEKEIKTKRMLLFNEIVNSIKTLLNFSTSDEDLTKEVNKDILLRLFEIYMESNEHIIESLYVENNVKYLLNLVFKKPVEL